MSTEEQEILQTEQRQENETSMGKHVAMFIGGTVAAGTVLEMAGAGGIGIALATMFGIALSMFSPEASQKLEEQAKHIAQKTLEKRSIKGVNWRMLTARNYTPDTEPPLEEEVPQDDEEDIMILLGEEVEVEVERPSPLPTVPPLVCSHYENTAQGLLPTVQPLPQNHARDAAMTLPLAENFVPDVDTLIGEGIVVFGSKGSGKTNVGALLAEQFSRFYVPLVIFDVEGDYASVVQEVPRGYYGGTPLAPQGQKRERYAGIDEGNAFQAGVSLLERGCQVVVDLSSYATDEQAAAIMVQMIAGMTAWANAQPPQERVPCLVFLDEAAYWLPQRPVSYLSKETQRVLLDTFHTLATKGRKRGLTPILLTQRISELEKSVMAQANIYFLGKQSLDNDLSRYEDYVNKSVATREQIAAFGPGQFVVKLADGTQFITRFHERHSRHISHTPKAQAALQRYTRVQKRPTFHASHRRAMPAMEPLRMQSEADMVPSVPVPVPVAIPPRQLSDLEQAVEAWNAGATSVAKLEKALDITHHKAYQVYQQMKERRLI